ncbi:hypothetical protein GOV03_02320 [Candidatus Woesearchaeota archaeon]|nr:hypothetical protein [Candidatus Woesearchaeota archaeon]
MKSKTGLALILSAALSVGAYFVGKSNGYDVGQEESHSHSSSNVPSCEVCLSKGGFTRVLNNEYWLSAKRGVAFTLRECLNDMELYGYLSVSKEKAAKKYLRFSNMRQLFIKECETLEQALSETGGYPVSRVDDYSEGNSPVLWGNRHKECSVNIYRERKETELKKEK